MSCSFSILAPFLIPSTYTKETLKNNAIIRRPEELKDRHTDIQKTYVYYFHCFPPQGQYSYVEKTLKKGENILIFLGLTCRHSEYM